MCNTFDFSTCTCQVPRHILDWLTCYLKRSWTCHPCKNRGGLFKGLCKCKELKRLLTDSDSEWIVIKQRFSTKQETVKLLQFRCAIWGKFAFSFFIAWSYQREWQKRKNNDCFIILQNSLTTGSSLRFVHLEKLWPILREFLMPLAVGIFGNQELDSLPWLYFTHPNSPVFILPKCSKQPVSNKRSWSSSVCGAVK